MSANTSVPDSKISSALEDRIRKLLRSPSHKVILTIPLECCHARRSRHLVIISAPGIRPCLPNTFSRADPARKSAPISNLVRDSRQCSARIKMDRNTMDLDYCLLGVNTWSESSEKEEEPVEVTALGFVCKILLGTSITLDGDGGFRVFVNQRHYIFKPATLQSLWTAIQTLHAISAKLKPKRNSILVEDTDWVTEYEAQINAHQSCINEWNEMPDISSRRPMSPDELPDLTGDAVKTETKKTVIKSKLREIMRTVDLDDITTKSIRLRLESDLNEKFEELKAFIDEEILLILGQMDPASRIFDFLFLGSEWNASNLEELNSNGVTHILNVTREIDNFFPAVFKYLNIREWDVEETDLLKYWDETYNFIHGAQKMGGKVLVHCKMGISRSASTVCSFAMKYFGWSLTRALSHTKERRSIINPNSGFREQLRIYEGILEASRQRNSFKEIKRSKSEGSMKRSPTLMRMRSRRGRGHSRQGSAGVEAGCEEGEGRHRRAASWSPAQPLEGGGDQEGRHHPTRPGCTSRPPSPSSSSPPSPPPVIYHCYSTLAALLSPSSSTSSSTSALPSTSNPSAVRTDVYTLPGLRRDDCDEAEVAVEAEEELILRRGGKEAVSLPLCPARFHIDQCTCNFEVELKVSDSPVDLFGETSGETDHILKNLGNFPIHSRQTAVGGPPKIPTPLVVEGSPPRELSQGGDGRDLEPVDENAPGTLERRAAEELSVKTLADMFDFRLGEQPTKPPLSKSKDRLMVARMSELARMSTSTSTTTSGGGKFLKGNDIERIAITDCSEC